MIYRWCMVKVYEKPEDGAVSHCSFPFFSFFFHSHFLPCYPLKVDFSWSNLWIIQGVLYCFIVWVIPCPSAVQSQYSEVCTSLHFKTYFTALHRILQHEVRSTSLEVLHFTWSIMYWTSLMHCRSVQCTWSTDCRYAANILQWYCRRTWVYSTERVQKGHQRSL